jgi:hypothetical protein
MELLRRLEHDDPVSELLRTVRVRSTLWCRSRLSAPWAFAVRERRVPTFHLVLTGGGWLEVEGEPDRRVLHAGDVVATAETGTRRRSCAAPSSSKVARSARC